MEGYVGEFDLGCGVRRLESGLVARDAARIGVDHARSGPGGMKRSPTRACRSYFREGRSCSERRRARRQNTVDTEVLPPMFQLNAERPAVEHCVFAGCVDQETALDAQLRIDDQC